MKTLQKLLNQNKNLSEPQCLLSGSQRHYQVTLSYAENHLESKIKN